jgi:hypothetical protein
MRLSGVLATIALLIVLPLAARATPQGRYVMLHEHANQFFFWDTSDIRPAETGTQTTFVVVPRYATPGVRFTQYQVTLTCVLHAYQYTAVTRTLDDSKTEAVQFPPDQRTARYGSALRELIGRVCGQVADAPEKSFKTLDEAAAFAAKQPRVATPLMVPEPPRPAGAGGQH